MPPPVTFADMYDCLLRHGPAQVVSSRDTPYTVEAKPIDGVPTIVGYPASGTVRIHEDCWGRPMTCEGTLTGGLLNGNPSLYHWYAEHCGRV
ncbi:MAG TPA: hypothetical protein VMD06_00010 [Steroidobacteraceae bacterium]|nr:hypothetical protein [Steroidobacteraceae bacterium]